MVLLKKGAEANILLENWHGLIVIKKVRYAKAYRFPLLDLKIRRSRTVREASIMHIAKSAGVPTPLIFMVDLGSTTIIMNYIEGEIIREALQDYNSNERNELCWKIGQLIAKLHGEKIVHGDLTTSNMIIGKNRRVYFIDFGLAELSDELEKRGVDFLLMKRAFYSTHYSCANECFKTLTDGYSAEIGSDICGEVLTRVGKIVKRGRYTI